MITDEQIVSKLAEYLSIAPYLTEFSNDAQYQRANQLALELAVWLEPRLYFLLGRAIAKPSKDCNPAWIISEARQIYSNKEIPADKVIFHAPGIGKKEKT